MRRRGGLADLRNPRLRNPRLRGPRLRGPRQALTGRPALALARTDPGLCAGRQTAYRARMRRALPAPTGGPAGLGGQTVVLGLALAAATAARRKPGCRRLAAYRAGMYRRGVLAALRGPRQAITLRPALARTLADSDLRGGRLAAHGAWPYGLAPVRVSDGSVEQAVVFLAAFAVAAAHGQCRSGRQSAYRARVLGAYLVPFLQGALSGCGCSEWCSRPGSVLTTPAGPLSKLYLKTPGILSG